MGINDHVRKATIGGMLGLSLLVMGYQSNANGSQTQSTKAHKNCYGLHIKENPDNITVEFYKEGWLKSKETVDTPITIEITKTTISYTHNDKTKTYALQMPNEGSR